MIYILNLSARLLVNHCVQSPWKDLNLKKRMLCTNFTVIHLYQNVYVHICHCTFCLICRSGLSPSNGFSEWVTVNSLVFVSLVVTFVSVIIVGLLFLYHTYLMITGQTTWEQVSRNRILYLKDLQEMSNPFNEGCCCNTIRFVCHIRLRDWEQVYQKRTTKR